MADNKVSKREQVKELIETGTMTKAEIAEELGMSPSSVSSQMTYLRWQGHFIKYDADKVLHFVTEDEFNAWQEELAANRASRSGGSTKSPEEQAVAVAKTLGNQKKSLESWNKKLEGIMVALEDEENDELYELKAEAEANITLLEIKIRRNEEKAASLPAPVEPEETEVEAVEETADDSDEDLL